MLNSNIFFPHDRIIVQNSELSCIGLTKLQSQDLLQLINGAVLDFFKGQVMLEYLHKELEGHDGGVGRAFHVEAMV